MVTNRTTEGEESESASPAFSRLSILRTLWKRKLLVTLTWILLALIGVAGVHFWPSVYLSEAVVLVDSQQIPEKFVSATVATDLDERIASIRELLLSNGELKKIIDDFNLYRDERKSHFEEEILEMMRQDISITLETTDKESARRDKPTVAFRIGYQASDPVVAMRVANRLTDLCVEQNLKTREQQAAGTSDFLDSQLVEAKKQLDQLEAAVSTYKLQHSGELPQQAQSLESALSRLQTELEANRDAINRAQQTRVILEGNLSAMEMTLNAEVRAWEQGQQTAAESGTVVMIPSGLAPKKKTSELLQEQFYALHLRYSDNHPDIIRLKAEIERVKRVEEAELTAKAPEAPTGAQAATGSTHTVIPLAEQTEITHMRQQVAGLQAQIKASDKELEDRKNEQQRILHEIGLVQARVDRLPVREQEMAQVTRDYEISRENYKSLLDKKTAAEMALQMERSQQSERFTVLDRAQMPEKPVKPNRPVLYAVAPFVALGLALVAGFYAELRRNVVLGEWELPAGTPVLARLPYIEIPAASGTKGEPARRRWFSRHKRMEASAAARP